MPQVIGNTVYGDDTPNANDTIDLVNDGYPISVVNIDGGGGNDTLKGDGQSNVISGGTGNDEITGGLGLDILSGGDGNDTFILTGEVNDTAYNQPNGLTSYYTGNSYSGGTGTDALSAGENNLTLVLTGTSQLAADSIEGIDGSDKVNFRVSGDASGNTLDFTTIALDNVTIDGNNGDDVITGSSVAGSTNEDRLEGGYGNDTVNFHGSFNPAEYHFSADTDANGKLVIRVEDVGTTGEDTGVDLISGFETLHFNDQDITIAMGAVSDTDGAAGASVTEHLANGTAVGIDLNSAVSQNLKDLLGNQSLVATYQFSKGGNPNNIFSIDPVTGVVTVANSAALDYETATDFGNGTKGYIIYVEATAAGVVSEPLALTVLVADGNDPPAPLADADASADEVVEGAVNGSLVGITAQAPDPNGNPVTYSLFDNAGGRFTIDPVTGVVTVANGSLLDFETQASWNITVRASDSLGAFTDQTFAINLTDSTTANWTGTGGADVFTATNGEAWTLSGGLGNDVIVGANLGDTLTGGEGNDTLVSLGGNDTFLYSGNNNGFDDVFGGSGYDKLEATADNTVIGINSVAEIEEIYDGGFQNVSLQTGTGNDLLDLTNVYLSGTVTIRTGAGDDTVLGTSGNDNLVGEDGNDTLAGNNGDDTFHYSGTATGFDAVDGGAGYDRLVADASNTVITLSSMSGIDEISDGGFSNVSVQGSSDDTLFDLSNVLMNGNVTIRAGAGADTMYGWSGADILYGEDGDDVIRGGAGADTLDGGNGVDTVSYAGSWEALTINLATNAVSGGDATGDIISGFENVVATDFNDTITGSTAANVITGGTGDDTMNGGDGNDTFNIGVNSGTDAITGGNGTDTIRFTEDDAIATLSALATVEVFDATGINNARIAGNASNNTFNFSTATLTNIAGIYGMAGNDTITGSGVADTIVGGDGNDTLNGGNGDDIFRYEDGDEGFDALNGGAGTDRLEATTSGVVIGLSSITAIEQIAGYGDTIIMGSTAANTLNFSTVSLSGIALIDGGAGNDTITGTSAQDTIRGGTGNDTLNGGDGDDYFYVNGTGEGLDLYNGGNGYDSIYAQSDNTVIGLGTSISGIEMISSGGYQNVRISGTTGVDAWDFSGMLLDGIVSISSGAGNDTITGSTGDDVIIGGAGADTLNGGDGIDTLSYAGSATAVTINLSTNTASGGDATGDIISNFENVTGSNGADTLTGNSGSNTLTGGSGNDRLTGADGFDTLKGDAGNDTFDFNAIGESAVGDFSDIIADFVRGQDKLDVTTIDANSGVAGDQNFSFVGAGAFTNVAGQLRFDNTIGDGFTHVFGDVNGDGVADFEIRLTGTYTLTATDFIL